MRKLQIKFPEIGQSTICINFANIGLNESMPLFLLSFAFCFYNHNSLAFVETIVQFGQQSHFQWAELVCSTNNLRPKHWKYFKQKLWQATGQAFPDKGSKGPDRHERKFHLRPSQIENDIYLYEYFVFCVRGMQGNVGQFNICIFTINNNCSL